MERALTLVACGNITMETLDQGKPGQKSFKLVRTEQREDTSFSESQWGKATRDYTKSVKSLGSDVLQQVVDRAKIISRSMGKAKDFRARSPSYKTNAIPDSRATLVYVPDSDEEACAFLT
jgi:hypothetical protein